jgi:hypothetical protein
MKNIKKLEEKSTCENNLKAIHKDKTPTITKAKSKVAVQTWQTTMDAFLNNPILIVYSLDLILSTRQHAAHTPGTLQNASESAT